MPCNQNLHQPPGTGHVLLLGYSGLFSPCSGQLLSEVGLQTGSPWLQNRPTENGARSSRSFQDLSWHYPSKRPYNFFHSFPPTEAQQLCLCLKEAPLLLITQVSTCQILGSRYKMGCDFASGLPPPLLYLLRIFCKKVNRSNSTPSTWSLGDVCIRPWQLHRIRFINKTGPSQRAKLLLTWTKAFVEV